MFRPITRVTLLTGVALALVVAGCSRASLPQSTSLGTSVEPATTAKTLLYVSQGGTNTVAMLDYPSYKAAGKLGGLHDPGGVCSDASGNVWVVQSKSPHVLEYPHGSHKSMASLGDASAGLPFACSVDPKTGNLAVTSTTGTKSGSVLIYTGAKGSAKNYTSSSMPIVYFCAYDASGNLFVDGLNNNYAFVLMELPSGSTQLQTVAVSGTINFPGGIAWDGKYLAVGDDLYNGQRTTAIDDLSISGTSATIAATVQLDKSCEVLQFAIVGGNKVAAPDACRNHLFVYPYPGGGKWTKSISGYQYPVAVAVSTAQ